MLDDAYNYLRLRNLCGKHFTREVPPSSCLPNRTASCPEEGITEPSNVDPAVGTSSKPYLFVWSAPDEAALKRVAFSYRDYIVKDAPYLDHELFLGNLAFTLSERRSRMPWRSFAVARSRSALQSTLQSNHAKPARISSTLRLCFVFTGQGAQWPGMGMELLHFPVFNQSLHAAEIYFQSLGSKWRLLGLRHHVLLMFFH